MVVNQELSLANEHDYKSTLIERAAHVFSVCPIPKTFYYAFRFYNNLMQKQHFCS